MKKLIEKIEAIQGKDSQLDEGKVTKRAVQKLYGEYFEGVPVDIFDLSNVRKGVEDIIKNDLDPKVEMPKLVAKYRAK